MSKRQKKTHAEKVTWGLGDENLKIIIQGIVNCPELNIYLDLNAAEALDKYDEIITLAINTKNDRIKDKRSGEYYEGHHIIPVCMGGEGKSKNPNHENIVLLTPLEHYMAHFFFALANPRDKMALLAFKGMCFTSEKRFLPPSLVEVARECLKIKGKDHHLSRNVWIVNKYTNNIIQFGSVSEAGEFVYGDTFMSGGLHLDKGVVMAGKYLSFSSNEKALKYIKITTPQLRFLFAL